MKRVLAASTLLLAQGLFFAAAQPGKPAPHAAADGASQTFHSLTDQYFDQLFHFNPSNATGVGFHQYDTQLEDYSAANVAAEVHFAHALRAETDRYRPRRARR